MPLGVDSLELWVFSVLVFRAYLSYRGTFPTSYCGAAFSCPSHIGFGSRFFRLLFFGPIKCWRSRGWPLASFPKASLSVCFSAYPRSRRRLSWTPAAPARWHPARSRKFPPQQLHLNRLGTRFLQILFLQAARNFLYLSFTPLSPPSQVSTKGSWYHIFLSSQFTCSIAGCFCSHSQ